MGIVLKADFQGSIDIEAVQLELANKLHHSHGV